METETIAAISTALGEAGIAVIRVSGSEAIPIVDRVFRGKTKLKDVETHTIRYGSIVDPDSETKIDEVLVTVMRAPRTFTREDVVEVSCHGGAIPVQKTLEAILDAGAKLAEPGEFTKRAFLNGRIDLSQAEAVMDLIRAKTDRAAKIASQQSDGKLSRLIRQLRHEIVETLAHLAVNVDYPEYDADEMTSTLLTNKCQYIIQQIEGLLQTAAQGKILREGIATAIIGRPNVGKSSLMNALTQENKAIVTDIPGTTRDVIEEYINLRGIPLRLLDTAGIRETEDIVERIGVERSEQALQGADLLLLLLNNYEGLQPDDYRLLELTQRHKSVIVINKMDLPSNLDISSVESKVPSETPIIKMSVQKEEGIDQLEEAIANLFFEGKLELTESTYVSNARHIHLLKSAKKSVQDVLQGLELDVPLDMVEIDLKNAWQSLGEVIGEAVAEDLIDQIFSQFCLGK
ncbi:tRNA uridine-5-carboxymethylaminomethyl(34) synthesis GTPase MnmE [Risungbinella massiliensis]|uniref:tRNA uridine-5-carboxymethylaminomethyl(34) synthesis GTPase MnmE n=1 Tax=Risungbinella massiliensis TaxID=1329796 RepID=UPI0005CB98F0|nr:tRNA uridine-5-carboxymethylaminomethyl(34) synthesis GTPase MnmE [Risungbinella massiliensis]